MKRVLLLVLVVLGVAGCPGSATRSRAEAGDDAAVGTGTVSVLVLDERARPIEGAVVWALGTRTLEPVPEKPALIEQRGLEFQPRFLVARKGQTLLVTNDDPENHNVHSSDACCSWNEMVPIGGSKTRVLDQAGEVTFLCDIHAHMRCVLVVLDSIHAITDAAGHARLALPLGKRKLRVRALDRDRSELEVDVAAVTSVQVTLPLPARGPRIVPPENLPWPTVAVHFHETLEQAIKWARAGNAEAAREAAEEADGKWFGGSGLFAAIKDFEKDEKSRGNRDHEGVADDLKSQVRGLARRAENAASQGGEAVDQLARQCDRIANILSDLASKLPKR